MTAAALVLGTASAAAAAPKPSESELKKQLAELRTKVDKLITDYNAKRVELAEAQRSEKAAKERLAKAESDFEAARQEMVSIAGLRYQTQTHDLGLLGMPDLQGSAVLTQLQDEQAVLVSRFATLKAERKAAADAAAALITEIRTRSEQVAAQRKDAEKLIADIKNKLDQLIPVAPGKLTGGGWAPELPSGGDNITPRTRLMKAQVAKHFDLKFTVGCYRAENDGGEHPLGRACDFMMSSGGSMPTPGMKALGDSVAAWAIKNGAKLGVKYVIWQQRIYNLGSPGWRPMSNRGGVTANHYDHVHISMY
ncbi:coiled-coil domain-containing protein [Microtetraspora niveoalba]|uniref:coiled-coil domain-containing protein n=1 Tax=Microtetraspora niveoalba TaxID=46175 RepID=UPI00082BB130|nr:hypothetical protein [Microtetraspora niveoalba]